MRTDPMLRDPVEVIKDDFTSLGLHVDIDISKIGNVRSIVGARLYQGEELFEEWYHRIGTVGLSRPPDA